MHINGTSRDAHLNISQETHLQRADEADDLLTIVKDSVVDFIRRADENDGKNDSAKSSANGHLPNGSHQRTVLVERHPPQELKSLLQISLPEKGLGRAGLLQAVEDILHYSVNTWDQGFLDKLYSAPTPVGLAADLLLSGLNTNLHVYQASPALTVIEKQVSRALASLFGLRGPFAGGVSQPGGSAANLSSLIIARNNLFPETKTQGLAGRRLVLFTSEHGHYSVEKAAQMCGFGSDAVRTVPTDARGRMDADALEARIAQARAHGDEPFYVNATAGTTVFGSFDPLDAIADVCRRHGLWFHVDASWGGSVVFSAAQKHRLRGIERADSITLCPHKMLNVPVTCSFLLGKDLREFHRGMTLPAGYLFHSDESEEASGATGNGGAPGRDAAEDFWDLADLTPQCGRRGDSLKLALSWLYGGSSGFAASIDHAYSVAADLASLLDANDNFTLVSEVPPPCLQVCFYYRKQPQSSEGAAERNSRMTEEVTRQLVPKGFMSDFAPGKDGKFFRVVINGQTRKETVERFVRAIEEVGTAIVTR